MCDLLDVVRELHGVAVVALLHACGDAALAGDADVIGGAGGGVALTVADLVAGASAHPIAPLTTD